MAKKVLMDLSFLEEVDALISCLSEVYGVDLDWRIKTRCLDIKAQIGAKFERMEAHATYTGYKTAAPGSQEREQKRNEYLEMAGIRESFRSAKETPL